MDVGLGVALSGSLLSIFNTIFLLGGLLFGSAVGLISGLLKMRVFSFRTRLISNTNDWGSALIFGLAFLTPIL